VAKPERDAYRPGERLWVKTKNPATRCFADERADVRPRLAVAGVVSGAPAADVPKRVPYALRHTFASLSIAAVHIPGDARRDLRPPAPDALDRARTALDSFVGEADQERNQEAV
jgi:hypothetical protein